MSDYFTISSKINHFLLGCLKNLNIEFNSDLLELFNYLLVCYRNNEEASIEIIDSKLTNITGLVYSNKQLHEILCGFNLSIMHARLLFKDFANDINYYNIEAIDINDSSVIFYFEKKKDAR